ncbi:hypothetical protein TCAL_02729 [Tigriopus californicus]|uniref:Uncharacterized protein n=1 Tax=Tigriopus californicus TaxID=6832 RepID=A0A553NQ89_TIGCA|nr:uncharacterized protein LOC131879482 [Tigriopus californicus]TRY67611.1 hypothetical protein TCAL_02729 [Tigriopus californicus]|eukprot:TCALIF_02729-PA protein Name:"Protein of unknown function" AED:0.00 eAED:0.00 QI:398/1/1/1/1/1/3/37/119
MKLLVLSSLLVIFAIFGSVESLQCYTCISGTGRDCTDISQAEASECRAGELHCTKIVLGNDVTRACFTGRKSQETGCKQNGGTISCVCEGDLCNGATSMKAISLALSIPLALLVAALLH